MKRMIKMLGLSAVAVLAFAAFAGASASASHQPEFESESTEFEIPFSGSGGAGKLETVGGRVVNCTGSSNSGGEIDSSTTTNGSTVKFTGCTTVFIFKVNCTTAGQSTGTIVTNDVKGELVYGQHESEQVPSVLLQPESGEVFSTFTCGGLSTLTVKGSVLGAITPVGGEFSTESTLTFTQTEGMQESGSEYRAPEAGPNPETEPVCRALPAHLETKGEGFPSFDYEQSAVGGSTTLTTTEEGVRIVAGNECEEHEN